MSRSEQSNAETPQATVEIYTGHHDKVPDHDPEWSATLEIESDWWGKNHPASVAHDADTELYMEHIDAVSGPVEIWCDTDHPVHVCIHTCDRYHDKNDWGKPMERGLQYGPDMNVTQPFGCSLYGRVLVWVAERDTDD